jgi:hypothetical protein
MRLKWSIILIADCVLYVEMISTKDNLGGQSSLNRGQKGSKKYNFVLLSSSENNCNNYSVLLSVHGRVVLFSVIRISLFVHCTDNEVCTDKLCTNGESNKAGLVIGTSAFCFV